MQTEFGLHFFLTLANTKLLFVSLKAFKISYENNLFHHYSGIQQTR